MITYTGQMSWGSFATNEEIRQTCNFPIDPGPLQDKMQQSDEHD